MVMEEEDLREGRIADSSLTGQTEKEQRGVRGDG